MFRLRVAFTLISSLMIAALTSQTAFASIVYIDRNEVWVANDNGSGKTRLSSGQNDWRQVAQSEAGYIVGIRKPAGKISQLATFTVWDPRGKAVRYGSLSGHIDSGLNVYPTTLDITKDGKALLYGYSRSYWVGTNFNLQYGTYLKPTTDGSTAVPYSLTGWEDGTLVGSRVIAHNTDSGVDLQDNSGLGSTTFNRWVSYDLSNSLLTGLEVGRTEASATGKITATEFRDSSFNTKKIILSKWSGLGGSYLDDCVLPASGAPKDITISPNGTTIAWKDSRGVVIAGAPTFKGAFTCQLSRAPRVISTTATMPSYGPSTVANPTRSLTTLKVTTRKPKAKKKISAMVRVSAAKLPAGSLKISVDGKTVRTIKVRSGNWIKFKLPKMKKGKHTVRATFTGTRFIGSASTLKVKVR